MDVAVQRARSDVHLAQDQAALHQGTRSACQLPHQRHQRALLGPCGTDKNKKKTVRILAQKGHFYYNDGLTELCQGFWRCRGVDGACGGREVSGVHDVPLVAVGVRLMVSVERFF